MTELRSTPGIHAGWRRRASPTPPNSARPAASGPRRCRVEHRHAGAAAVLARGLVALARPGELAPFVSRLRRDGAAGEVTLVDEATGAELARRAVVPRKRTAAGPAPSG